ncbi:hypothetical protein B1218_23365, partial [Pseudomonas ogarae]
MLGLGVGPAVPRARACRWALPGLRPDLQLSPAAPGPDASPQWPLADPVRWRYFELGAAAMRMLRHWSLGDP